MGRFCSRRRSGRHPDFALNDADRARRHVVRPEIEGRAAPQIETGMMPMAINQLFDQRQHVGEGKRLLLGGARRKLNPATASIDAFQHELERPAVDTLLDWRVAQVFDHELVRRFENLATPTPHLIFIMKQIMHTPTELMGAVDQAIVDRRARRSCKTHPDNTSFGENFKFPVGDLGAGRDHGP
jgi:hypothetical protein